ncbi:MAG: hypothetical protein M1820_004563 [Bogoriella megaspora]|nr:MAG: hypothetical protein M1820_004563 [Bogoriella megaspora]
MSSLPKPPTATSPQLSRLPSSSSSSSSGSTPHTTTDNHPRPSQKHLRSAIIGLADGLTVPFALTAGLSSLQSPRIVILAGLAELFSGAISMGLGAYLAAGTEAKGYKVREAEVRRRGRGEGRMMVGREIEEGRAERGEVGDEHGDGEIGGVVQGLMGWGVQRETAGRVVGEVRGGGGEEGWVRGIADEG